MKKQILLCSLTGILSVALVYPHAAHALAPKPSQDSELLAQVCVGVVVLAVGGVVVMGMSRMCSSLNRPPPAHHTIPKPMLANMAANYTRAVTNSATTFNFDESAVESYDISALSTNASFQGPDGLPYQFYFNYSFRTSTNLSNWETNSVSGYVSPTWTLTQIGTNAMLAPRGYMPVFGAPSTGSAFFFQPLKP